MSKFDFSAFRINGTTIFPKEFIFRAYEIGVTPFNEADTGVTFDEARSSIIGFLDGMVLQSASPTDLAYDFGVPIEVADNLYALFILHWDCGIDGCFACTTSESDAALVDLYSNFDRDSAIKSLNTALRVAHPSLGFALDVSNPLGGAFRDSGFHDAPSGSLFNVGDANTLLAQLIDDAIPGGLIGALAASIAGTARTSDKSVGEVIEEMEAHMGMALPEGVCEVLEKGTYPGGPNSEISEEEFLNTAVGLFGVDGAPLGDSDTNTLSVIEGDDGTFSFHN